MGYVPDTTVNLGGVVHNGDSQAFLITGTVLGAPTFSLEAAGPKLDLYDANFPSFFNHTVWAEQATSSMWGHQVLGVTCGVAAYPPAINNYFIDGKLVPTKSEASDTPVPCNQPSAQGDFVIGGSPTLAVNQWTVQGTITAALVYGVQLTPTEQAQNAAYIAAVSKSRGYTGVPIASASPTGHIIMTGDSITDCFGTAYGDCWVSNALHAPPVTTLGLVPVNIGLSGSSAIGSMQAVIARECTNISPGSPVNIVHIFLGTNDLANSKIPPTNEEIGAALAYGIQTLHTCAAKLGAGVKIGIATILSRGVRNSTTCAHDPGKDSLDAYLAANWQSLGADILDDYGASPLGFDNGCLNSNNFQLDETHPSLAGGNTYLLPILVASNSYLTSTQTYPACAAPAVTSATTIAPGNICTNATIAGSPVVLTLPNCTGFNGAPFYIRNVPSASQSGGGSKSAVVSIAAPSSQLLNGRASTVSLPRGSTAMLTSSVASYTGGGCAWNAEIINPETTTALSLPSPTLLAGQLISLTASVAVTTAASPLPGPPPSGSVTFYAGTRSLGSASLDPSGTAVLNASSIGSPIGTFPVTAVYAGAGAYSGSTSPALPITIQPSPTSVTLEPPLPVAAGNPVTLTAFVARSTAGTPTGTVTFSVENIVLGTVALKPRPTAEAIATLTGSSAGIPPGRYPITATYSGDSADLASKSAPVTLTIK